MVDFYSSDQSSLSSSVDLEKIIDNAKRFAGKVDQENHFDDSLIDRLHHRYTVAGIVCFCVAMASFQYLGTPIECWVPAQFNNNYEDYTNRLCYLQNTYHVPKWQSVPRDQSLRQERTLKYYQWIHFVLLLQALFFSVPRILWQSFNDRLGPPLRNLVEAANQCETFDMADEREAVVQFIADRLQRNEEYVNQPKSSHASFCQRLLRQCRAVCQARTGASLACFYIFIKCLYIINVLVQICFLQYFLSYHDINYLQYGLHVFGQLLKDFTLPESNLFPRVTLCDFQIRELGAKHRYTVECILVINIFIEKLYFVLWLWFAVLLGLTVVDAIRILYRILAEHSRNIFIIHHLDILVQSPALQEQSFRRFLQRQPMDNVFVLRILSSNASPVIVAEILSELLRRQKFADRNVLRSVE